jgi:hypothetical protein
VENSGDKWRGRYPWDWHAEVGFATGYSPEEWEKLVDTYMTDFSSSAGALMLPFRKERDLPPCSGDG